MNLKDLFACRRRLSSTDGITASLCLTAITHTYLLFHCAPYVGYMSVDLLYNNKEGAAVYSDLDENSIGWYAGLLGTAFTTGRCIGFVPWKRLRHSSKKSWFGGGSAKRTLVLSLFLSTICSIWFGMSETFLSAFLARFCLGLSNTISGCVKRIAIDFERNERAKRATTKNRDQEGENNENEKNQTHTELAPARVLAVMWWGTAIGPLLGGTLSNPGTYKQSTFLPDQLEQRFPYFLPNAVAAILCFLSMILVAYYVTDIVIVEQQQEEATDSANSSEGERQPLLPSIKEGTNANATTKLNNPQQQQQQQQHQNSTTSWQSLWQNWNTRKHLIAYWAFSFVVVSIEEALPLFLIAQWAGPGLAPQQIGWILSMAGFIVVIFSHTMTVQHILTDEHQGLLGFYPGLKLSSVLGNVPSVLIPIMLILNGGSYYTLRSSDEHDNARHRVEGESSWLTWLSFVYLVLLTGCLRVFCYSYFALIGTATARTVPSYQRDEVARVMTLGALYVRALAPIIGGSLVSLFMSSSRSMDHIYKASFGLWSVIGLVFGLMAAALTFRLQQQETSEGRMSIKNLLSKRQSMYLARRQQSLVPGKLWEFHYHQVSESVMAKLRRLILSHNKISDHHNDSETSSVPDIPAPESLARKKSSWVEQVLNRRETWSDHFLQPGVDPDTVSFFILGTRKDDTACSPHVLSPPLMDALQHHLPMSCEQCNFWLKYSLLRDGASITALESKLVMTKNTIVAIETLEGDVFGCFMAKPWARTSKFEFCGESFLWRRTRPRSTTDSYSALNNDDEEELLEYAKQEGDIEVFPWTGENDECQLLSHDRIGAGNGSGQGFGFLVENSLSRGTSSPCPTYGNPSLVSSSASPDGLFEVANMEVWAMTYFLFAADAEKSEATIRSIQANLMNTTRGASSAQSAWTEFL